MAYITLNKNNFFNNLDIITNHTKSKDKIAIVLKDNAYGHGLIEIASLSKIYGIKKAVVRFESEAKRIEKFFEYILVLADYPTSANAKMRYAINDINSIQKFAKGTKVELKVDTGMHRNGIDKSDLRLAFIKIKKAGLKLEAVFSHHRSADELTSEWFWQNSNFKKIKDEAKELAKEFGFKTLRFHSANSASLFRTSNFDEDMARVGIAVYGCLDADKKLAPVLSLYAQKISTRSVKRGQKVGYGGTKTILNDCLVSNYDFGYGDGFFRTLSNNFKTPHNKELIGKISMDNSSFIGEDEQLLIFKDARVLANLARTIPYEILTSLKADLKREIL
ncbi:MAG: alanine racemase [Sulfurimonas sp.]|nr:alanine racemase [Sulfurimonas sp.]